VRSLLAPVLLVSLAITPLISSCGGASPETRARQTMTAQFGTRTPTPREATWTAIDQGTVVGIDQAITVILTAEAILPVARPLPPNASRVVDGTVAASAGAVMTGQELTEAMITAAMAKADARVCAGSDRCYPFPDRLEDARRSCTPKGRCKIGWIVSRGGRERFDVWLEIATGLVKLIRQADA
jgi:hypothetical protein